MWATFGAPSRTITKFVRSTNQNQAGAYSTCLSIYIPEEDPPLRPSLNFSPSKVAWNYAKKRIIIACQIKLTKPNSQPVYHSLTKAIKAVGEKINTPPPPLYVRQE
jgi:hypothetical protein